jgi:hypothetical protein
LSIAIKAFSGLKDEKRVFRTAQLVRIIVDPVVKTHLLEV